MTTPLEKIVDISIEGGFSVKPHSYNGESFRDAVKYMQEAHKVDITTTEGLEAYEELTGENLGGRVGKEADYAKEHGDILRSKTLMTYTKKHFSKLLDELDDDRLMDFAVNHVPTNPLKKPIDDEHADPYEIARDTAYSAIKTIENIGDKPNEVLDEAMEEGGIFAVYVAMDPNGYLEVQKSIAQERAVLAIGKIGAKKFITTTKSGLEKKANEKVKLDKKMQKDVNERGEPLTAQQRAELNKSSKLGEYDDCKIVDDMYQGIIRPSIQGINQKMAKKRAKENNGNDSK